MKCSFLKKLGVLLSLFSLAGCSYSQGINKKSSVNVVFEDNENVTLEKQSFEVLRGKNLKVDVIFNNSATFVGTSYKDYTFDYINDTKGTLILKNVKYSCFVSINVSVEYITYYGNGGISLDGKDIPYKGTTTITHLRNNTISGPKYFQREGYVQVGWNTKPDYSGTFVGCGSRIYKEVKTLYAQWVKETDASAFEYTVENNEVFITKYLEDERQVVIPKFIKGMRVIQISPRAFQEKKIESLVLSENMFSVPSFAFMDCNNLKEITFYDNLQVLKDDSFYCCSNISTLHINAILDPCYSASYFDAFPDKIDYLESIKNDKKIVLFSGSSTRYGFWSEQFMEAFPEYKCSNMGVFAYVSALMQLEVIEKFMIPGDILIDAPEFDVVDIQMFYSNDFEGRSYAFFEANYDLISLLDVRHFGKVFSSWYRFQQNRNDMEKKSYEEAAKYYDDEGNRYDYETYNIYGDMTLDRPNHDKDELIYQPMCNYKPERFHDGVIDAYNEEYHHIKSLGIDMVFTYAPKNHKGIYGTEEEINQIASILKEKLECPVISDIWDSIFLGYYFYLIDNHLSDEGATIRTRNVINDLKIYLSSNG